MIKTYPIALLFTAFIALTLQGCGGGSASDDANYVPLGYDTDMSAADISAENAMRIFSVVWNGGIDPGSLAAKQLRSVAARSAGPGPNPPILHLDYGIPLRIPVGSLQQTVQGNKSGSVHLQGESPAIDQAKVTAEFTDFNNGNGVAISGTVELTSTSNTTEGAQTQTETLYLHNLTYTDANGFDITIEGTLSTAYTTKWITIGSGSTAINKFDSSETTTTIDAAIRNNRIGRVHGFNGFKITSYRDTTGNITACIKGRVFVDGEGYIDIDCENPLAYDLGNKIPNSGGPIVFSGANSSKAHIYPVTATAFRLEVVANGATQELGPLPWPSTTLLPNLPPKVYPPSISPLQPTSVDDLQVELNKPSDPENQELSITYQWFINDEQIEGATQSTLKAGKYRKNDVVKVVVAVSDGGNTVTVSAETTIADQAPSITSTFPETIDAGETWTQTVEAVDGDSDPVTLSLAYGPIGMSIDANGTLSWKVTGPLFGRETTMNFGITAVAGGQNTTKDYSITVVDPAHPEPMFRFGLALGSRENMVIDDFDNDGKNELLVTDYDERIYTLEYDGTDVHQDWAYPYVFGVFGAISAIATGDLNGDDVPDIVVGTDRSLNVVDGSTKNVVASQYILTEPRDIKLADVDNDGNIEIVLLAGESFLTRLEIYDSATLTNEWTSDYLLLGYAMDIGNVDEDGALEIVTSRGFVFDGVTRLNEWAFSPGFGTGIRIADTDNDGINEIIGYDDSGLTAYDAKTKSTIWSLPRADTKFVKIANIDDDPQPELFVVCGFFHDFLIVYDGISHAEQAQYQTTPPRNGIGDLVIGDLDKDGKQDIVVAEPSYSNPTLSIATYTSDDQIEDNWSTNDPAADYLTAQGPYGGALPAKVQAGQNDIVFSGPSIVTLNPSTGDFSLRLKNSSPHPSNALDVADFNDDGIDDFFLGFANTGSLSIYDVANSAYLWESQALLSVPAAILAKDVNGDGHKDVISLINGKIYVYSAVDQTLLLSTSIPSSSNCCYATGSDLLYADIDADGTNEIVVRSLGQISVFRYNPETKKIETVGATAIDKVKRITTGDVNADGKDEIVVLYGPNRCELCGDAISVLDENFEAIYSFNVDSWQVDEMMIVSIDGHQSIWLVTHFSSAPNFTTTIRVLDFVSGKEIMHSPNFIGTASQNSMHFADVDNDGINEILLGTSFGMYVIH